MKWKGDKCTGDNAELSTNVIKSGFASNNCLKARGFVDNLRSSGV